MSMGSIYLRKDGRWKSRISLGVINGKRRSKSFYGKTKEEAESKMLSVVMDTSKVLVTKMNVKGYIGSVAAIRMFMQKERAHAKRLGLHGGKDYIHRITLSQLVYRNLEDVKLITQDQYEALLKQYPELAALYGILRDFHRIVFSKKAEDLEHWIEQASHLDAVPELKSFVDGLKHDIFAI